VKSVLKLQNHRLSSSEQDLLATFEDFGQLFAREMTELFSLAMDLTADADRAETCLILAMRDCFQKNSLAKHRVHAWARRMVIRNAIRLVLGVENEILCEAGLDFPLQPRESPIDALMDSIAIRNLPDLDRLAFVICVVERYSILDCALLLRKAPQEVHDAIVRATNQVVPIEEPKDDDVSGTAPSNVCGSFWVEGNKLDGSCGSIFD
jgi:DNA-directed RNA polymerase specialized sigma24 family protein